MEARSTTRFLPDDGRQASPDRWRALSPWRSFTASIATVLPFLALHLACSDPKPRGEDERSGQPGLPPAVVKIAVSLDGGSVVDCTGTLIDESWVLTSAHCFSEAPTVNFATIQSLGASVRIGEILVHPEATFERNPAPGEYKNLDIVAAHDLALMPLRFAVTDRPVAAFWEPEMPLADALRDLELIYTRTFAGDPFIVDAVVDGLVDAADLLEDEQPGQLLAATGPAPVGGDSGGGAFLASEPGSSSPPLLVGVVQDAPLGVAVGRFGLVPLWPESHRSFIDEALSGAPE